MDIDPESNGISISYVHKLCKLSMEFTNGQIYNVACRNLELILKGVKYDSLHF